MCGGSCYGSCIRTAELTPVTTTRGRDRASAKTGTTTTTDRRPIRSSRYETRAGGCWWNRCRSQDQGGLWTDHVFAQAGRYRSDLRRVPGRTGRIFAICPRRTSSSIPSRHWIPKTMISTRCIGLTDRSAKQTSGYGISNPSSGSGKGPRNDGQSTTTLHGGRTTSSIST